MKTANLMASFDCAEPLEIEDILLSELEQTEFNGRMVHTVLRIIVRYGGKRFAAFQQELRESLPKSSHTLELRKTDIFPLTMFHIDKSSTVGNADVADAILEELGRKGIEDMGESVRVLGGDQLLMARLRAVAMARAGNELRAESLENIVRMPGLFHYVMAMVHGIMETYLGRHNHDRTNPASLNAHNDLLQRTPIVASSLPPFRTCFDLIKVSLIARVLHLLLLVSGKASLEEYCEDDEFTWVQLKQHASLIVHNFTDSARVDQLRIARELNNQSAGDMIFESAVLFLRDALTLCEFSDARKAGDSGRLITVLKIWAVTYRGFGRTKYAGETMYFLHDYLKIWPRSIR